MQEVGNDLCFDMDGVIILSEDNVMQCEQTICSQHGITAPKSAWLNFKGRTSRDIFNRLVSGWGNPRTAYDIDAMIAQKRKLVIERIPTQVELVPGALTTLEMAKGRSEQVALTTSSSREIVEAVFDHFGLERFFDVVVTGDDVPEGQSKPHPRPYGLTFERLGRLPRFTLEDSDNGIISAREAGSRVVGITTSFAPQVLLNSGATHVVGSHEEFQRLVF